VRHHDASPLRAAEGKVDAVRTTFNADVERLESILSNTAIQGRLQNGHLEDLVPLLLAEKLAIDRAESIVDRVPSSGAYHRCAW